MARYSTFSKWCSMPKSNPSCLLRQLLTIEWDPPSWIHCQLCQINVVSLSRGKIADLREGHSAILWRTFLPKLVRLISVASDFPNDGSWNFHHQSVQSMDMYMDMWWKGSQGEVKAPESSRGVMRKHLLSTRNLFLCETCCCMKPQEVDHVTFSSPPQSCWREFPLWIDYVSNQCNAPAPGLELRKGLATAL
jgi:hypothetical protein